MIKESLSLLQNPRKLLELEASLNGLGEFGERL